MTAPDTDTHARPRSMSRTGIGPPLVIALGGNAILRQGDAGTIEQQTLRAREALEPVADLIAAGRSVVLTHGNGPVVGNIIMRNEAVRDLIPPMPLYIAGADSEGGIGFMLQNVLGNLLGERGVERGVVSLVTQVEVDAADPAFTHPDKPIGPYMGQAEAEMLAGSRGWSFIDTGDGLMRRVVPSPRPREIIEAAAVEALVSAGEVVIAAGGGGVPVVRRSTGALLPVEAVIDKDRTGALLAEHVGAAVFAVLMEADALYLGWGSPHASRIERITVSEAHELLASGSLEPGTIAPKVAACARFVERSARPDATAIISGTDALAAALSGRAGTHIVQDHAGA